MQINISDLRTGNLVHDHIKNYFMVDAIDAQELKIKTTINSSWYLLSDFEPIQLTEDLLKKMGFTKHGAGSFMNEPRPNWRKKGMCLFFLEGQQNNGFFPGYGQIVTGKELNGGLDIYCTVFASKINYLHQIQNLYKEMHQEELHVGYEEENYGDNNYFKDQMAKQNGIVKLKPRN